MRLDPSAPLAPKETSLVGLAASIAAGCQPCTNHWLDQARAKGACERSIRLAIETGLAVRSSATESMAEFAASIQAGPPVIDPAFRSQRAGLIEVMACGAALAVRSTTDLEQRVERAHGRGASTAHISATIAIARTVCTGAQKEVDEVVRRAGLDLQPKPAQLAHTSCCETPSAADTAPEPGCNCNGGCT